MTEDQKAAAAILTSLTVITLIFGWLIYQAGKINKP